VDVFIVNETIYSLTSNQTLKRTIGDNL